MNPTKLVKEGGRKYHHDIEFIFEKIKTNQIKYTNQVSFIELHYINKLQLFFIEIKTVINIVHTFFLNEHFP